MEVVMTHILQQYFEKKGYEVILSPIIEGRYHPDMLVIKGDEKLLIEVKMSLGKGNLIKNTISQVLVYATYLKDYEPFIASGLQPNNEFMDILRKYGIGYMWEVGSNVEI